MDENKSNGKTYRFVYAIIERGQGATAKTFWQKCGIAYVNHDQSINLYLDTLPLNGKLQIRERDELRDQKWRNREAPPQLEASATSFDFGANIQ
jgi:hypothetical protein